MHIPCRPTSTWKSHCDTLDLCSAPHTSAKTSLNFSHVQPNLTLHGAIQITIQMMIIIIIIILQNMNGMARPSCRVVRGPCQQHLDHLELAIPAEVLYRIRSGYGSAAAGLGKSCLQSKTLKKLTPQTTATKVTRITTVVGGRALSN